MKPDREERLWEVARYLEVLLRCDVSSLQFDRVAAILDEDYTLTIADLADVIGRANVPEEHSRNLYDIHALGHFCFDHTVAPMPAGELLMTFFELMDPATFDVDEETAMRAVQALVTRNRESLEDALRDDCMLVRTAACLNDESKDMRSCIITDDSFKPVGVLSQQYRDWPIEDEYIQEFYERLLPGTFCGCQSAASELSLFFEQLGLMLPWPPGLSGDVRVIGALAWTTLEGLTSIDELEEYAQQSPEEPTPEGMTVTFRRTPDGHDRLELLHTFGPLAGRLELAIPNYVGMREGAEPSDLGHYQAWFLVDDVVADTWREAVDVLQGVWEHLPVEGADSISRRPRSITWNYSERLTLDGDSVVTQNEIAFRAPSGGIAVVEADHVQGAWAALRDLTPGWRS
jgi:hypothetical protein